jgi:hypothetical protein
MQRKCRLCFKLYFQLKALFWRFVGRESRCQEIHAGIPEDKDRAANIYRAFPHCACEKCKISALSPGSISADEQITRLVFSMHASKNGALNSSLFSHIASKGCSVQREKFATSNALNGAVQKILLGSAANNAWLGSVNASASDIRNLCLKRGDRAICLYDTAEPDNRAHAEMFYSRAIEEADAAELRNDLYSIFGEGVITKKAEEYRDGSVWAALPPSMQARTDTAWKGYAAQQTKARAKK